MTAFEETSRVCRMEVDDGLFTQGAQVSVWVGGERRCSLAFGGAGNGVDVTPETVFRVYCTGKPLTAVAVAQQVEAGVLDLDQPLCDHLPEVRAVADGAVTLRHVLNHTAGVHRPMALEVELLPPAKRRDFLDARERPAGWRVGAAAAYSEFFGWHLVGRVLEEVTGEPLGQHLRAAVLEPLGLADTFVGMTEEEYDTNLPRIGVNYDLRTQTAYPTLLERGRRMCTEVNPAHGTYSTADDLARFYAALLFGLSGERHAGLPGAETLQTWTTSARPRTFDLVLGRECDYGLGFMTDLAGHAFGRSCSRRSFGHSGNVGSSFAFADADLDLAVGVVFNGIVDPESAFLRRPVLVRAIYADVGPLVGVGGEEAPKDGVAPQRGRSRRWFRRRER